MIAWLALSLLAQDEGLSLNRGPIRFRSVELRPGILAVSDADLNVGDLLEIESDGLTPDRHSRLVFDRTERLDAFTLGVRWDFNLFKLAVDGFVGDWEGEGTLSHGQVGGPATVVPVDLEGDAWGVHFTMEYPALRYLSPAFETSLGPVLGVNWAHQEVEDVPESPMEFDGHVNALMGSIGLRLNAVVRFDRLELSAEVEPGFTFGQLQGTQLRAALGIGLSF